LKRQALEEQMLFKKNAGVFNIQNNYIIPTIIKSQGDSMKKYIIIILACLITVYGCAQPVSKETSPEPMNTEDPSFFITSVGPGDGANLGGLEGADSHCNSLAEAAGIEGVEWKAYLSTTELDARDRIGSGPWYNVNGEVVATNVENLHSENSLNKETALDENGDVVNGRGDTPNRHDILTGSQLDGTRFSGDEDTTCSDWTSNSEGSARVGHHDRIGGGDYPESWNSAHGSRGCSQENLQGTGGDGLFYCFGK